MLNLSYLSYCEGIKGVKRWKYRKSGKGKTIKKTPKTNKKPYVKAQHLEKFSDMRSNYCKIPNKYAES